MKSEPLLIPAPVRLSHTGGQVSLAISPLLQPQDLLRPTPAPGTKSADPAWLRTARTDGWCGAAATDAQSYTLRIFNDDAGSGCVEIESPTAAGLRLGRATLVQLLRQYQLPLTDPASPRIIIPAMNIEDRPAFATRGVMLDVSRDRIPTMRQFKDTIDLLASLKYNHLQLYTEHTFAYAGHEEAWRDWSPLTPAEVIELDAYAHDRGIELAANQNCFGHLRSWLEHPKYQHLAETHGDWMFDVWPRKGPFSLCPTDPKSLAFVNNLLAQLMPCFRSPLVNIGCDETYDIAFGRSKSECDAKGRGVVFAEFVAKICEIVRASDKRPMFWADIALSHPDCLELLPNDLIALAWGYEPDSPFDQWGNALAKSGMTMWVCPGTSTWRSITGRTAERTRNLQAAADAGLRHESQGYLVCDWGDTGHWQQWPITAHALANAAQAAWNPGAPFSAQASSLHVFGDTSRTLGPWLERLGDADHSLRQICGPLSRPDRTRLLNQSAIFIDLFKPWDQQRDVGPIDGWQAAIENLEQSERELEAMTTLDPLVRDELTHTLRLARTAVRRGLLRRQSLSPTNADADALVAEWNELEASHRRLWAARSRPGGLEHSCSFFQQVLNTLVPVSTPK